MNPEELKKLREIADRYELRLNPAETEETIREKVAAVILRNEGDAIRATEILLGKQSEDFTEEENRILLGIHMIHCRGKSRELHSRRDTFYSMPWNYYKNILFEHGFDKVLSYEFKDTYDPSQIEEYLIFARPERGFLLTAESYNAKTIVNSTTLYFELSFLLDGKPVDEILDMCLWNSLDRCGHGPCLDEKGEHVARYASRDAREGFVSFLSQLETYRAQLNSPWKFSKEHFLWLCDYSETKEKYDYKEINQRKISALPREIQSMIGFAG